MIDIKYIDKFKHSYSNCSIHHFLSFQFLFRYKANANPTRKNGTAYTKLDFDCASSILFAATDNLKFLICRLFGTLNSLNFLCDGSIETLSIQTVPMKCEDS